MDQAPILNYDNYLANERSFVKPVPTVIINLTNQLGNLDSWSFATLRHKLGMCEVTSCYSIDGRFGADPTRPSAENKDRLINLPFHHFIERVFASNQENGFYYLQQGSLLTRFLELKPDWTLPKCIRMNELKAVNLWIGPQGGISVLHYDRSNNFLVQLAGYKRIVLYHPLQYFNLYPFNWSSDAHHISQINNIDQPDLKRFPRFNRVKAIEVLLKPGEVLYIPPFWWHQVYSLESSISVNIWWHASFHQKMVPAYLRFLMREIWRKWS